MAEYMEDLLSFLSELPFLLEKWKNNKLVSDVKILEDNLSECEERLDITASFLQLFHPGKVYDNISTELQLEMYSSFERLIEVIEEHRIVYRNRLEWHMMLAMCA